MSGPIARLCSLTACVASLALGAADARGAGFATVDGSAAAMGAGGTAAARADDPGAAAVNPACAAAKGDGLSLALGAALAAPRIAAGGDGWSADTEPALSVPPHAYVSWSAGLFAAGASVGVPFGSRVRWPAGWQRRFDAVEASLTVVRVGGWLALRTPRLVAALGPTIDFGSLELHKAIDFIEAAGETRLSMRATGVGLQAGVLFRAAEDVLDLGLSYRSRSRLRLDGYADFAVPPELRGNAPDQAVSTSITLPDRIALGAALRLPGLADLALFADLEIDLWSTFDQLAIDFTDPRTPDQVQPRNWKTTVTPRLGAAYRAVPWLTVRAGLFVDTSPAPAETAGPASPDSTRLGLSAGAGIEILPELTLDLAVQHLELLGVTSLEGTRYRGAAELASASIAWRQ